MFKVDTYSDTLNSANAETRIGTTSYNIVQEPLFPPKDFRLVFASRNFKYAVSPNAHYPLLCQQMIPITKNKIYLYHYEPGIRH